MRREPLSSSANALRQIKDRLPQPTPADARRDSMWKMPNPDEKVTCWLYPSRQVFTRICKVQPKEGLGDPALREAKRKGFGRKADGALRGQDPQP
jgi:hypothetical protein